MKTKATEATTLSGSARTRCAMVTCAAAFAAWTLGVTVSGQTAKPAPQDHDHATATDKHETGAHVHAAAAKLVNPVKSTPASLTAGKVLYDKQCASCHGATGKGDGKTGTLLTPKPSDLTDASWKHGPSDGEIYTLVKDGAKNTGMKGYASKMTAQEMWSVVNYMRSLHPAK